MEERRAAPWVERMERTFGFREPRPDSVRRNLAASLGFLVAMPGGILGLFYVDDDAWRLFSLATVAFLITALAGSIGQTLRAGAFGGRFRERGRTLRAIHYLAAWPVSIVYMGVVGNLLSGPAGALVGGAAGVALGLLGMVVDLRHARSRAAEPTRSGSGREHP